MDLINSIICCPRCKEPITLTPGKSSECKSCADHFRWINHTWNLIPSDWRQSSDLWPAWEQLQENGVVAYREDPEHNLQIGERKDSKLFSRFCQFDGLVLDVGCGPQPWPSHFCDYSPKTVFIGVDPLAGPEKSQYLKLCALGEYLPFADNVFDQVLFATTLEHFIDPEIALLEARRVCKPQGAIIVWIGEKSASAPKPKISPAWYQTLKKPEGAVDPFHFKRLAFGDIEHLAVQTRLQIVRRESHPVDPHRVNHFFELKKGML